MVGRLDMYYGGIILVYAHVLSKIPCLVVSGIQYSIVGRACPIHTNGSLGVCRRTMIPHRMLQSSEKAWSTSILP